VLIILVAVAVSILAGWIFHRLIEAPSLKLSKRFAYGSRDSLRGPIAPEP
jgi:peptidoglycan/LPS O-acetylase OafA/YrhL